MMMVARNEELLHKDTDTTMKTLSTMHHSVQNLGGRRGDTKLYRMLGKVGAAATMVIPTGTMLQTVAIPAEATDSEKGKLAWQNNSNNSSNSSNNSNNNNNHPSTSKQHSRTETKDPDNSCSSRLSDDSYKTATTVALDMDNDDESNSLFETIREPLVVPSEAPSSPHCRRSIPMDPTRCEGRFVKNGGKCNRECPPPPDLPEIPVRTTRGKRTRSVGCCCIDDDSNNNSKNSNNNNDKPKTVGFGSVTIRIYQQILGDNPSVSYGPPIQLDWVYDEHDPLELDAYERKRGAFRRNRRQLAMSYYTRKAVLTVGYGIDPREIVRAKKEADKIKFRRGVTKYFLPVMKVEDALESAGRKAKRMILRKRKQQGANE